MKNKIIICVLGICVIILAQPKPFIHKTFLQSVKEMSTEERRHLNEYRRMVTFLGLDMNDKRDFENIHRVADELYHLGVDINSYKQYKEQGIDLRREVENMMAYSILPNPFDSQLIIEGPLLEISDKYDKNMGSMYGGFFIFKVEKVHKGKYLYKHLPTEIKCYTAGHIILRDGKVYNHNINLWPKVGDNCLVYLKKEDPGIYFNNIPIDFNEDNVFTNFMADNFTERWYNEKEFQQEIYKINILDKINKAEIFNPVRKKWLP